jgi:hypothetical protein
VQLLAAGCQVAAPPTPGYEWIDPKDEPLYCSAADVWRGLALDYGLSTRVNRWSNAKERESKSYDYVGLLGTK